MLHSSPFLFAGGEDCQQGGKGGIFSSELWSFTGLCCFSLYMHVRGPCPMPLGAQHTAANASHMVCAVRPRQMAHRICLGQWHCSFDIIPKHWHPLQYPPPAVTVWTASPLPPSSTCTCCLLWCFYWLKIRVLNDCWRLAALIFWSADTSGFLACSDALCDLLVRDWCCFLL